MAITGNTIGGKVTGPGSSTNNAIAKWNGTTGKLLQDTGVLIDSSNNIRANNCGSNGTNTVSSGTPIVLTVASTRIQNITGSSAQTIQLPDATTLFVGARFEFNNNSTGALSINDNGSNLLYTVPAGGKVTVEAIAVVTANGSWDIHLYGPSNSTWGTAGLITPGSAQMLNMILGATNRSFGYLETTLNNAAVLNLNGTPQAIGTSPGANKIRMPLSAIWYANFAAAYASNTTLLIQSVGATAGTNGCSAGASCLLRTGPAAGQFATQNVQFSASNAQAFIANQALQLFVITGNPTGGNAANKLSVCVFFVDIDISGF